MKKLIREKIKRIDKTDRSAITNLLLKPISMLLTIVYTPLLLRYLGQEQYGLWATILSLLSWINYFDVGIGQGLRNILAGQLAMGKLDQAKKAVSTAYIVLSVISSLILLISIAFVINANWYNIFNTKINMKPTVAISVVFICINFVLALSNTLLYALQLSERVALRNCFVQVLNIFGLLFLTHVQLHGLIYMAILFGCSTAIVYVFNSVSIFKRYEYLTPQIREFDRSMIGKINNVGLKFFAIQIACVALFTVDNLLITNLFGGAATTPYSIVDRVFSTAYALFGAVIVPYWSKTTIAIMQSDYRWIHRSIKKLNILAVVFCLGCVFLALIFKFIAGLWLGTNLAYPTGLIPVMCVYYCAYAFVMVNTQFINGTGRVNTQLIVMVLIGLINVPFAIFCAKSLHLGVVGIRLATTILIFIPAVVFPFDLKRSLRIIQAKDVASK